MKIRHIAGMFLAAIFLASFIVYPAISQAEKKPTLKICANSNGQILAKSKCKKGETQLNLSSLSSAGLSGPQGQKGDKGDTGSQGPAGITGLETISAPGDKTLIPASAICTFPIDPGCLPGIPTPGNLTVNLSCPDGKLIFAHVCPDKKIVIAPGIPPTIPPLEVSVLINSTVANGKTLTCTYSNTTTAAVEIPFVAAVVCGPL